MEPYIPKEDLDNANIHEGEMPWYAPDWATAITRGNDIYFRDPKQTFCTARDLGLLGHELGHVGQGMTALDYLWASRNGYANNRYYRPTFGRFVAEDPIGFAGGQNLYLYGLGNPISYTDPRGLRTEQSPRPPSAPYNPLCIRWTCLICEEVPQPSCPPPSAPPRVRCTTFSVNSSQPGSGVFFEGGYMGDAARMPECRCTGQVK
jgi:RHS repeat-associated protein